MAAITILGTSFKISTEITKEQLETLKAFAENENATVLTDAEGNPTFAVTFGPDGSATKYGITFSHYDGEGKMFLMGNINTGYPKWELNQESFKMQFAPIIRRLRKWEEQMQSEWTKFIDEAEADEEFFFIDDCSFISVDELEEVCEAEAPAEDAADFVMEEDF